MLLGKSTIQEQLSKHGDVQGVGDTKNVSNGTTVCV